MIYWNNLIALIQWQDWKKLQLKKPQPFFQKTISPPHLRHLQQRKVVVQEEDKLLDNYLIWKPYS